MATVLVAVTASVLMLLAGAVYSSVLGDTWQFAPMRPWQLGVREGGLVSFVVGSAWMRAAMDRGRLAGRHYVIFVTLLAWAGLSTWMWLGWPMHDIALFWDGHGRWGCHEAGKLATDRTLPFALFGPALLAVAAHAGLAARGRQGLRHPATQGTRV